MGLPFPFSAMRGQTHNRVFFEGAPPASPVAGKRGGNLFANRWKAN
jgi:hypothetical protein